ncbi:MAG: EamA family transporter [Ignavibacteriae bacterium]|nr:EamA family transporter [Ignavibacteriota bacterium]MCB9215731.1 EamA family transporter [Ignavibacteria bacterium]
MLFVLLTIFSSLTIALILKFNETRSGNRLALAGANYVVASLLGFGMGDFDSLITLQWVAFAALLGGGFVAGFLLLMKSIRATGLAITGSVARTATIGPVLLSIIFYSEHPNLLQIIGIACGVSAFLLLGLSQRQQSFVESSQISKVLLLTLLFLVMTFNDFGMKIAEVNKVDISRLFFVLFGTAGMICWSLIGVRRMKKKDWQQITRRDLLLGGVLGIPNYFSSWFLIRALQDVPASIVFPTVSAGGVIAVTLAAVLLWHEELSRPAWIGIGLAAIAVALLGM